MRRGGVFRRGALAAVALCCLAGTAGCAVAGPAADLDSVTPPPTGASFDYQIGGAYEPAPDVRIVTRDRTDPAPEGRYAICYVNAFQTQPGEQAFATDLLLVDAAGAPVMDPDWPDEQLLDLSTDDRRQRIAEVVGDWFAGCAADGYDAVEPDNLDSWTRSQGLLSQKDTLSFTRLLIERAHRAGLAIGQKNAAELINESEDSPGFDFAVTEECQVFDECDDYLAAYGDHVIEIEYSDGPIEAFEGACAARGDRISIVFRDRDVLPVGVAGRVDARCGD